MKCHCFRLCYSLLRFLVLLSILFTCVLHPQPMVRNPPDHQATGEEESFLKQVMLRFNTVTSLHWLSGKGVGIGDMYGMTDLIIPGGRQIRMKVESRVRDYRAWRNGNGDWNRFPDFDQRVTTVRELYVEQNVTQPIDFIKATLALRLDFGKLVYRPSVYDIVYVRQNENLFLFPPSVYGGALYLNLLNIGNQPVSFHTVAFGISEKSKAIRELYARYLPSLGYGFGLDIQAGYYPGTAYALNRAALTYRLEETAITGLEFDAQFGKQLSYDQAPFGGSISIQRAFHFIAVGVLYDRRIDDDRPTRDRITYFYRFIKPDWLVEIMSTYSPYPDFEQIGIHIRLPILGGSVGKVNNLNVFGFTIW